MLLLLTSYMYTEVVEIKKESLSEPNTMYFYLIDKKIKQMPCSLFLIKR